MNKTILTSSQIGEAHYNLAPIKYKFAWDMYLDQYKNSWLPNETPVGGDLAIFKSLSPSEQHLFITVFANLTTSDLCVQENLALKIYGLISAPEIKQFIAKQIETEALHSYSYQYIIEHLNLDEDFIYNLYKTVPAIAAKFEYANKISKEFDIFISNPTNLIALFRGLVFYYICFEGGWFFNGFSPIFSLARRQKMMQSSEQLQYILRDESQHTVFGVKLINALQEELSFKIELEQIRDIIINTVQLEKDYIRYAVNDVVGYSADLHIEHLQFLLDRRLLSIGLPAIFGINSAPLPWLSEMVDVKKEKNFFETRVTEYQTVGQLTFEFTGIEDILNWRKDGNN